ncbi:MAG: hypothetical protein JW889_12800 [Verrucomicrobia bacterium]|nr:hypothetical protein [Verrucomicrobiota bacterium]
MRKKLIRTMTILFGLYFFLEFFLPKEVGGDFDKTAIRSPSVLHDPSTGEYRLYYVGVYNRRTKAVGRATSSDGVTWAKQEGGPVIRSTLFRSADRLGFSSLSPIKVDGGYELYYLGSNMETPPLPTICWASSTEGTVWQKRGRIEFTAETPWRQREEIPISIASRAEPYGNMRAIAAANINGVSTLYIAQLLDLKTEVLLAQRTGPNGRWVLQPEPVGLGELPLESNVVSLSYVEKDGAGELWVFVEDKSLYRVRLGPEPSARRVLGRQLPNGPAVGSKEGESEPPSEIAERPPVLDMQSRMEPLGRIVRRLAFGPTVRKIGEEAAFMPRRLAGKTPKTDRDKGPARKFLDLVVTADADGYRVFFTKPSGKEVPEDEVPRTQLFTTSSPDGTTWDFAENTTRVLEVGTPAQPLYLTRAFEYMGTFIMVLGAFTVGIGAINMGVMHGRVVIKGGKGLPNSIVFFLCTIIMFAGTMWGKTIVDKITQVESAVGVTDTQEVREQTRQIESEYSRSRVWLARVYNFLFLNVNAPLGATLFALVSFYMVGAAFRSFRIKSMEAGFLILSAIIVLIGQIPIGTYFSTWLPLIQGEPAIPWLKDQLLTVLNAAAYRAVLLGLAVGTISMSIRLWLGLEKGMFHGT